MDVDHVDGKYFRILKENPYWRVCHASALVGLKYNNVYLKQYSSYISQVLSAMVYEVKTLQFKVSVISDVYLKSQAAQPDALLILVEARDLEDPTSEDKVVYKGIFMSWGGKKFQSRLSTHLPIYFEYGSIYITNLIHIALGKLFNCRIFTNKFNFITLFSTALKLVLKLGTSKGLILKFPNKNATGENSLAKFILHDDSLIKLWESCSETVPTNDFTDNVILTFTKLFEEVQNLIEIDLTRLRLNEISFKGVVVDVNGRMTLKNGELIPVIFDMLQQQMVT